MASAVELHDVVKRFGKFTALDKLSLDIAEGELYGLLGPNGSGKTTAIRIVMGLEKRNEGRVRALGRDIPDRSVLPSVGYMPQETALYNDLTVRENLVLFGELFGMDAARIDKRIVELLKLVELTDWGDTQVSKLSGGMRHRTSLVASMIHDPKLLLLDEPTVGVDPELRATFWTYFRDLAAAGHTILITTHYMDEARNCDRIGLIRRGQLIAEDTPVAMMQRTQTDNLEDAFLKLAARRSAEVSS